jgi:hypothetical protein
VLLDQFEQFFDDGQTGVEKASIRAYAWSLRQTGGESLPPNNKN